LRAVNAERASIMETAKSVSGQLITVSERARAELIRLEATGENFLRISVIPGGCSGMTYNASIDNTAGDTDQVIYQDDALRVVADGGSSMFLDGLAIDYSDDLIASGFRFKNPKARKTCGCGSSFAM
jgi:iron-sulfur cluster assembly protein